MCPADDANLGAPVHRPCDESRWFKPHAQDGRGERSAQKDGWLDDVGGRSRIYGHVPGGTLPVYCAPGRFQCAASGTYVESGYGGYAAFAQIELGSGSLSQRFFFSFHTLII